MPLRTVPALITDTEDPSSPAEAESDGGPFSFLILTRVGAVKGRVVRLMLVSSVPATIICPTLENDFLLVAHEHSLNNNH